MAEKIVKISLSKLSVFGVKDSTGTNRTPFASFVENVRSLIEPLHDCDKLEDCVKKLTQKSARSAAADIKVFLAPMTVGEKEVYKVNPLAILINDKKDSTPYEIGVNLISDLCDSLILLDETVKSSYGLYHVEAKETASGMIDWSAVTLPE
jgi:hypothetical protein